MMYTIAQSSRTLSNEHLQKTIVAETANNDIHKIIFDFVTTLSVSLLAIKSNEWKVGNLPVFVFNQRLKFD